VCDSREEGDHYAEGYPVSETAEGGVGRLRLKSSKSLDGFGETIVWIFVIDVSISGRLLYTISGMDSRHIFMLLLEYDLDQWTRSCSGSLKRLAGDIGIQQRPERSVS